MTQVQSNKFDELLQEVKQGFNVQPVLDSSQELALKIMFMLNEKNKEELYSSTEKIKYEFFNSTDKISTSLKNNIDESVKPLANQKDILLILAKQAGMYDNFKITFEEVKKLMCNGSIGNLRNPITFASPEQITAFRKDRVKVAMSVIISFTFFFTLTIGLCIHYFFFR